MRKFYLTFLLTALLAIMGNALLPFTAHPDAAAAAAGKILICTSEGYRYVDAGSMPITPQKPHCLLCVLAAVNAPLVPSTHVTFAFLLLQSVAYALLEEQPALPRIAYAYFISRAPPFLS